MADTKIGGAEGGALTGAAAVGTEQAWVQNAAGTVDYDITLNELANFVFGSGTAINALSSATLVGTEEVVLDTDEKASINEIDTFISATTKTLTNKTLDDAKFDFAINAQVGTAYTGVLADGSKVVTMSNAAANTFTIPTNASVAYAVGTCVTVIQLGAGATSVAGDIGVTLNGVSAGSGALGGQYSAVTLFKIATDTWVASGDIATVA